jgi:predicted unusual protein kinase regulating ubiquinone biosynthesis (AarF/ABC1/UbiB family)
VIKVLHPNIDKSVDSDLAAMRSMFITGRLVNRDRAELEEAFEEIRERLHEEIDYYQEAANLEFFKAALADVPHLRIPGTYPEFSTQRVLTMDRLEGATLDEFLETSDDDARQRAGHALAVSFHEMVHSLHAIHADPHAGNYLFEPDGTVGLLDFGCVRRYSQFWAADYARLGQLAVSRDREASLALCVKLGALTEERRPEAEELLWELLNIMCDPFRIHPYHAGSPEDRVQEQINGILPRILRYPEIRAPRELIYLNRALNGMYSLQRRLGVRCDYGAMFWEYSRRSIARAEGRLPAE